MARAAGVAVCFFMLANERPGLRRRSPDAERWLWMPSFSRDCRQLVDVVPLRQMLRELSGNHPPYTMAVYEAPIQTPLEAW